MENKLINSAKCTLMTLISAFLGAWAGCDKTSKNWRRVLIPFALSGLAYGHLHNLWVLTIMFLSVAFSTGYGIPDPTDEGSALGKFWYKLFKSNELLANMGARGTIAIMVNASLVVLPILKGNWYIYIPCCWVIKMVYIFFSWKDLGGLWVKNRYLLWCDLLVYGIIGLATTILIFT